MRTTINIEDDVLDKARGMARRRQIPFRRVVNEALRAGLQIAATPPSTRPYRTQPHQMGLRAGRSLDNVQDLMAQMEGENHR